RFPAWACGPAGSLAGPQTPKETPCAQNSIDPAGPHLPHRGRRPDGALSGPARRCCDRRLDPGAIPLPAGGDPGPLRYERYRGPDGGARQPAVADGAHVALVISLAWLSTRPRLFNRPVELTPGNAQSVYREGERMMVCLLVALVVIHLGAAMQVMGAGAG